MIEFIISYSDSRETYFIAPSNESESDREGKINDSLTTDIYFLKTKILTWNGEKNIPSQSDPLSAINLVDKNNVGPKQIVPQSFKSLL